MSSRTLPLGLLTGATLLILALAFTNNAPVALSFFGVGNLSVPEGVLLAAGYVLGIVLTLPLLLVRVAAAQASQERLAAWDQQDKKLAQQVQSDREKQLEAKIATLETALQKALQKK